MSRTNTARRSAPIFTHEGAKAVRTSTINQLRRSVLSCLLFEDEFYEDGIAIAKRIKDLCAKVSPQELADLATEARQRFHLRHVPLVLLVELLAKRGRSASVAFTIASTIGRVDELGELLALYLEANPKPAGSKSQRGAGPIPKGLRRGLDAALRKFDAYQFAKYDNDKGKAVKLRDVLRIARPKPAGAAQEALFKAILKGTLAAPDTWEVAAMQGRLGKDGWEQLLRDGKLGYLALLRNLRNMVKVDVDMGLIERAIVARKGAHNVWPFRYVAAARAVPQFEPVLDQALIEAVAQMPQFDGDTIILVDVSGSMSHKVSGRSDISRMDAAATLASIFPGRRRVFTFSNRHIEVPARTGMAGVDAIVNSQAHSGTELGVAVSHANQFKHDRLVVISDEQTQDRVPDPIAKMAYMINVASNENGVGYGRWTHIDGFSESVLRFMREYEDVESGTASASRD